MKAAVLERAGRPLVIEEVPDPAPGPRELVIAVRACGICGTDLHWSERTDDRGGWRALPPGTVMGHEFAGEVVEVGSELRGRWRPGERVVAQPSIGCGRCPACLAGRSYRCPDVQLRASPQLAGAYAEYARVGALESFRLPESLGYREGALVEPLAVGLNAVSRARLRPGESVLVIGAGPIGLAVARWCAFFGARHVVVSDLVAARAERALALGATAALDATREDAKARAAEICGAPPPVIFDCVGVPGSLQLAIDHAEPHARVVVTGLCMEPDTIAPATAITRELDLIFTFVYSREEFATVVDLLGRGRLDASPLVTGTTGLDRFPEVFESLKRPGEAIKVMLEPGAEDAP